MTPFMRLILDVLADGALSGYEIARAVEESIPGALDGRDGWVYPALVALEREEAVVGGWEMRTGGRRRVYRRTIVPPEASA